MNSVLVDSQTPWVADLFRRMDATIKALERLDNFCKPLFNGQRYITDKELSATLSISRRTLQEYRSGGLISYYLIGGKVIYKVSDVQQLLENAYKSSLDEMILL